MWAIEDMHVTTGEPETPEDPHKKEAVREAEAASQFMFCRKYAFDNQVEEKSMNTKISVG